MVANHLDNTVNSRAPMACSQWDVGKLSKTKNGCETDGRRLHLNAVRLSILPCPHCRRHCTTQQDFAVFHTCCFLGRAAESKATCLSRPAAVIVDGTPPLPQS